MGAGRYGSLRYNFCSRMFKRGSDGESMTDRTKRTQETRSPAPRGNGTPRWLPALTEIWILVVVVVFLLVRVVGSNSFRHFVHRAGH